MQEVIETARQTTLSLIQMQKQVPSIASTPQSPPQQVIGQKLPAALQAMIPQTQIYAGVPSQLHITSQTNALSKSEPPKRRRSHSRSSSRSRSRSSSRSRSRDRYRRRSRSPRGKAKSNRSHRDRSSSRERERRRTRPSRFDNSAAKKATNSVGIAGNNLNAIDPQLYQQNAAFVSNAAAQPMLLPPQLDPSLLSLSQQQSSLGAFSTNDVRKMNMNMAMQSNPLAFSQAFNPPLQAPVQLQPSANALGSYPSAMPMQAAQQSMAGVFNPLAFNFPGSNMNAPNSNSHAQPVNHCVRIRNICNITNYSIIRKFFGGLLIPNDGIKLINNNDGNRTGQAYVRFVRPAAVAQAIARSNRTLGKNVIQIEELSDSVFDDAIDSFRPRRGGNFRERDRDRDRDRERDRDRARGRDSRRRGRNDYSDSNDDYDEDDRDSRGGGSSKGNSDNDRDNDVMCISDSNDSKEMPPFTTVLIEDLPPFTKEQDIMKMFSSYPLVHIIIAKRPKMFSSYVKFHSAEDAKAAVKDTTCHKISFKTVYVSPCSEEEYEIARKEFSGELDLDLSTSKPSSTSHANISNEIRSPDPSEHLNENGDQSSIPTDPRMSAAQFLPVASPEQRVDPRMRGSAASAADASGDFGSMKNVANESTNGSAEPPTTCVFVENMEYRTTEEEITEWLQSIQLAPIRIQLLVNHRNQTNGECFVQLADNESATRALQLHQTRFKSRSVRVSLASWQHIQETMSNIQDMLLANGFTSINTTNIDPRRLYGNQNQSQSQNSRSSSNSNHHRTNNNRNNFERCVVALTNVPYKANIDDILDFFSDFDISPNDVIRRYNDEGKPTGDARICFKSPMDARRAVEQRDKCRIMSRPIYLSIL